MAAVAPLTACRTLRARRARAFATSAVLAVVAAASPACDAESGVGDPCTPEAEYNSGFNGYDVGEAWTESNSFQCRTRICLVNHFRGRVSCPYGQDADKQPLSGRDACTVPDAARTPVEGDPADRRVGAAVPAQCLDRTADRAVYCSCRCADINGERPSGQTFCDCPDGFTCETGLVRSIGQGNEGLTGSYCIKTGTAYDSASACTHGACNADDPGARCK